MSTTSESSKSGSNQAKPIAGIDSLSSGAAGFPDQAVIQRMASDFFGALNSASQSSAVESTGAVGVAAIPTDVGSLSLPVNLPAATPTLPSATHMVADSPFGFLRDTRSIFALTPAMSVHAAEPAETTAADLASAAGAASVPTDVSSLALGANLPVDTSSVQVPTDLSAADSSFGFLRDARNLFAAVPTAPLPAAEPVASKPETQRDWQTPQIPGAAIGTRDAERLASFGFLDTINPLEPLNVAPTLSPVSLLSTPLPASFAGDQFDVAALRRDFPILQERVNGRPLVWLDNAATTQKPQAVIDRLAYFYTHENSNVHRAAHTLAARATDAYEAAREKVAKFLNAGSSKEIIFLRGATEAINLVAQSWGRRNIQKDDEIVISWLEHHANIVPWQMLCAEKGAKLRVAPVDNTGQVLLDEYERLLNSHTKLVAFAHVSNALGTITPVEAMVEMAHRHGAKVLVDGAQAVSHMAVDVQAYDCDFYVFSGHKIFAPTGVGVVYGKQEVLEAMPPWQGGGNMIADVTFEKTIYQPPPGRFEAGTGTIADAVGLGAAIDYVSRIGMVNINRYEHDLLVYATDALQRIPGLHLIGTAKEKASVLSFVLDGYGTEDVGAALSSQGIAVRSGHHCAQPILRRFGVESTVRPSLAFYNTCEEIDALVAALWNLKNGRTVSVV